MKMAAEQMDIRAWLALIQAEYRESPGLSLTKAQAQRLWGLDAVTCEALMAALEETKFLRRTEANRYIRISA
jgi:hypothetical protein